MPETIECHSCHKKFRKPPSATPGTKFRCPGCKAVLTVPEPEEEAIDLGSVAVQDEPPPRRKDEPPPMDDEPEPAGKREADTDWPIVGRGATMHMIANAAYAGALVLMLLGFWIGMAAMESSARPGRGGASSGGGFMATMGEILAMLVSVAWFGGFILALLASGMWMASPWKNGSRGLAIALLALTFMALQRYSDLATAFTHSALGGLGGGEGTSAGFSVLGIFLLEAARFAVLSMFMESVGRNVKQSSLATTAGMLVFVIPGALLGVLFIDYILFKLVNMGPTLFKILITLTILVQAGMAAWSMAILMTMTSAVRRKGRR